MRESFAFYLLGAPPAIVVTTGCQSYLLLFFILLFFINAAVFSSFRSLPLSWGLSTPHRVPLLLRLLCLLACSFVSRFHKVISIKTSAYYGTGAPQQALPQHCSEIRIAPVIWHSVNNKLTRYYCWSVEFPPHHLIHRTSGNSLIASWDSNNYLKRMNIFVPAFPKVIPIQIRHYLVISDTACKNS
jgi:hypothetical protein